MVSNQVHQAEAINAITTEEQVQVVEDTEEEEEVVVVHQVVMGVPHQEEVVGDTKIEIRNVCAISLHHQGDQCRLSESKPIRPHLCRNQSEPVRTQSQTQTQTSDVRGRSMYIKSQPESIHFHRHASCPSIHLFRNDWHGGYGRSPSCATRSLSLVQSQFPNMSIFNLNATLGRSDARNAVNQSWSSSSQSGRVSMSRCVSLLQHQHLEHHRRCDIHPEIQRARTDPAW